MGDQHVYSNLNFFCSGRGSSMSCLLITMNHSVTKLNVNCNNCSIHFLVLAWLSSVWTVSAWEISCTHNKLLYVGNFIAACKSCHDFRSINTALIACTVFIRLEAPDAKTKFGGGVSSKNQGPIHYWYYMIQTYSDIMILHVNRTSMMGQWVQDVKHSKWFLSPKSFHTRYW